jgi:hypothetical protein
VHAQAQVKPEPAHRQRPERMAVTEADRLINARFADPSNYSVQPGSNLLCRLPTGNLTVPNRPTRDRFQISLLVLPS